MFPKVQTRRDALRTIGGGVAATCLPHVAAADPPAGIIDTHVHVVGSRNPGLRAGPQNVRLGPFDPAKEPDGLGRLARQVADEMTAAGTAQALCMPSTDVSDDDPLGVNESLGLAAAVKGVKLHAVGVAHPERFDRSHLARVEEVLAKGRVKALKAYLGYAPYEPSGPGFRPYYKLAAKYNIPVILHTGDTWSRKAKVKFAHPLKIDEVAVDFPETKFVLAHFGNPWVLDAAEVVYKNDNVWADLSAFLVGDATSFTRMDKDGVLAREADRIRQGIEFVESYDKFLFGTDWPLVPLVAYRDFVRRLIPEKHQAAVFRDNAKGLYRL
jgi:predicted TIM-barrel fold metal-dependent hydrolase